MSAHVHQCDDLAGRTTGNRPRHQFECRQRRKRLDVDDIGFQPRGFGSRHPVLDLFLAGRRDQDIDVVAVTDFSEDLEVEVHFLERERNVLIGFRLDLQFHLLLAQATRQHDTLGDHRRCGQGHGHQLGAAGHASQTAAQGFGYRFEIGDVAVRYGISGKWLDGVALDLETGLGFTREFHHLHR